MATQSGCGARDIGAQGQNRTADTRIFSPLLYRLSYLGLGVHYWKLCFVYGLTLIAGLLPIEQVLLYASVSREI